MNVIRHAVIDDKGMYVGWREEDVDGSSVIPLPDRKPNQRARWDGKEWHVENDTDLMAEQCQQAIDWIDATADHIRASDRSVGQYLNAEYQLVAQALADYRAQPDGEVPDAIQSYATAEGLTVEQAAEQIAEAAARADELLQAVRRIRLAGKAAIRDASDDADFMETARPFIDQLEALSIEADSQD